MPRPRRNQALDFSEGADDAPSSERRPKKRPPRPKPEPCPCGRGLPKVKCAPKHVRESAMFRTRHLSSAKKLIFIGFDIETKKRAKQGKEVTDESGFDDCFLITADYGDHEKSSFIPPPKAWRNAQTRRSLKDPARAPYERGGCIREFLEENLVQKWAYDPRNGNPFVFVAHNGGNFDFNHICNALARMRDRFKFEVIVNGSRVISITVIQKLRKKTIKWRFLDSGLPVTLAKLGKIVGEEKLEETDLDMPEGDPRWDKYGKQDSKVIRVAMTKFQEVVNELGGEWKQTLPGTVLDLFRRRMALLEEEGLGVKIHCNRHFKSCPDICKKCWQTRCWKTCPNKEARDEQIANWRWDARLQVHHGACEWSPDGCAHFFARRGFYGGRTEMFRQNYCNEFYDPISKKYNPPKTIAFKDPKTGKTIQIPYRSPFRIYDINSSYPASMRSPMPIGGMTCYQGKAIFDKIWARLEKGEEKRAGFIECTVYIPEGLPYPPLPIRADGKVKFPTGFVQGVWTSIELLEAVRLGCKIRAVNQHIWINTRPVFRPMIADLWGLRAQAKAMDKIDKAGGWSGKAEVYKLLMNAFFGKWGMAEYRDEFLIADDEEGLPEGVVPTAGLRDAQRVKHVIADYINPAIAAWITALSRLALLQVFLLVHRLLGFVWYGDTDSVHCNVDLPESDELGALKREFPENEIVFCRYDTAKVYEIEMAGPCPDSCSHRNKKKGSLNYDKPCGRDIHVIVKSKGIQEVDQQKIRTLRRYAEIHAEMMEEWKAGRKQRARELKEIMKNYTLVQRRTPKFRALFKKGFDVYETNYESVKSMTMTYNKRELDRLTGLTKPEIIQIDQVVREKRAKTTPNLKKWDEAMVSVAERERLWREGIPRLAAP